MLLNAFLPAIAQGAMYAQAQSQGNWADVCTSQGSAKVKVGIGAPSDPLLGDSQSNDPHDEAHLAKCQLCLTHAGTIGLPPVVGDDGLRAIQSPEIFLTQNDPNQLYLVWPVPSARAPPAI